jgi:hypothetical protein
MQTVHPFLFFLPWLAGLLALSPAVFWFVSQNRWARAVGVFFAGVTGGILAYIIMFALFLLFIWIDATLRLRMLRQVNPVTVLVFYAAAVGLGAWCGSRLAAREDPGY